MGLLGDLGIDVRLLIAQIINFGLLLFLLSKFVYEPVMKRIEEDEAAEGKLKELEKQTTEFEERKKTENLKAKRRTREMLKEAEGIAERIQAQARQEAEAEKQAIITQIQARLKEIENAD